MEIKDYSKQQELLGQLGALKEMKALIDGYDEHYETAKKYVMDAWDGKLGEEAEKHVGQLVDIYDDLGTVVKEMAKTLRLTKDIQSTIKEEKKNMTDSKKMLDANIGEIMKDILHDEGLVQGDITFPRFGTVRCTLKKDLVIINDQLLKEELVNSGRWDLIKSESLAKLKKAEGLDMTSLTSIEEQEIPKITITSLK